MTVRSVDRVIPPGLLEGATPGNRAGVARAYAHAAAWIREGQLPPEDLAVWLADRLQALSVVLHDVRDKNKDGALAALWIVEKGKRGKKPASGLTPRQRADLVRDVLYFRSRAATLAETFERVVAFHALAGHLISTSVVEAAWKDRKALIPEMNP